MDSVSDTGAHANGHTDRHASASRDAHTHAQPHADDRNDADRLQHEPGHAYGTAHADPNAQPHENERIYADGLPYARRQPYANVDHYDVTIADRRTNAVAPADSDRTSRREHANAYSGGRAGTNSARPPVQKRRLRGS